METQQQERTVESLIESFILVEDTQQDTGTEGAVAMVPEDESEKLNTSINDEKKNFGFVLLSQSVQSSQVEVPITLDQSTTEFPICNLLPENNEEKNLEKITENLENLIIEENLEKLKIEENQINEVPKPLTNSHHSPIDTVTIPEPVKKEENSNSESKLEEGEISEKESEIFAVKTEEKEKQVKKEKSEEDIRKKMVERKRNARALNVSTTEAPHFLKNDENYSKLNFSRVCPSLAKKLRNKIKDEIKPLELGEGDENKWEIFESASQFTFILPNLSVFSEKLKDWIENDLIQKDHMKFLEKYKTINWDAAQFDRLTPLFTQGDGNCLLHAITLGMFGIHDRDLVLRSLLHSTLTSHENQFKQRWLYQRSNQFEESTNSEWAAIIKEANPNPRSEKERVFEYLSKFHIFVLAHILRRPVIVYADRNVRDYQTEELIYELPVEERMDGIYLPLLCNSQSVHTDPLALGFHSNHFSPLVASFPSSHAENSDYTAKLALVDCDKNLLPVHYLSPEEEKDKLEVLSKWMVINYNDSIVTAEQIHTLQPEFTTALLDRYFAYAEEKHKEVKKPLIPSGPAPCVGGCGFMGTPATVSFLFNILFIGVLLISFKYRMDIVHCVLKRK